MNRKLFFGIGFAIWLLATIVFRAFGHIFFWADEPLMLLALWIVTIAAMVALPVLLFRWRKLTRPRRFEAAVLLVISGMVLDALAIEVFDRVFPNMPPAAASSFGAWLLVAYASVLLAAFLPSADD